MYLNTIVDKKKYKKTHRKIIKLNKIISLMVVENKGYVIEGKVEKDEAFYFGKYSKKADKYRLLSKYELVQEDIEITYKDYINVSKKFIDECSNVTTIIMKGGKL